MITGDAVHAALHGVNEHAALGRSLPHEPGEVVLGREGVFGFLVGDEFHPEQQSDAAHIAHSRQLEQRIECRSQDARRSSLALIVCRAYQLWVCRYRSTARPAAREIGWAL